MGEIKQNLFEKYLNDLQRIFKKILYIVVNIDDKVFEKSLLFKFTLL